MNKKWIIVIVAAAAVVIGLILWKTSKKAAATPTHTIDPSNPTAPMSVTIGSDNDGLTVHFAAHVLNGTAPLTYQWDCGDGTKSTLAAFDHTYVGNPLVTDPANWQNFILAYSPSSLVKSAGDHVSHPTSFRLATSTFTWAQWLNTPTALHEYSRTTTLYAKYKAGTWDVQGGVLAYTKLWATNIEEDASALTKETMTLNDFACGLILAGVVMIEILGGMGAMAGGLTLAEQVRAQAANTFNGTVTLTVADSTGATAEAAVTVNVTK